MRLILSALIALLLSVGAPLAQPAAPLDVDEAFALSVTRDGETVKLRWAIAPGYYLYRDNVSVMQGTDELPVTISQGVTKDDPGFGTVEVIFDEAVATLTPESGEPLRVDYQGCQDGGICYRPEARMIDAGHARGHQRRQRLRRAGDRRQLAWPPPASRSRTMAERPPRSSKAAASSGSR